MNDCPYGFRIVGPTRGRRWLVDAADALAAYADCDDRAEVEREAYLSAFCFGEDFRHLLTDTGSTAGFAGACWSPWLWFDLDREDLERARRDACRLLAAIEQRYRPGDSDLLLFFSGRKGFHVGLPTALWSPSPSDVFHRTARRFAENIAELAGVAIDCGVYDKVRAFRAPNSRHSKTGLHKRWLPADGLAELSIEGVLKLAQEPTPFELPTPTRASPQAAADWEAAADQVAREGEAKAARRANGNGSAMLNRATLEFIRHGAEQGDRHRLLFSAAANLGEFGCPPVLAVALLEEPALDSGLPPKEVRRQVECGLAAAGSPAPPSVEPATGVPPQAAEDAPPESADALRAKLATLWNRGMPAAPEPRPPAPQGAVSPGPVCCCGAGEMVEREPGKAFCNGCGRFLGRLPAQHGKTGDA